MVSPKPKSTNGLCVPKNFSKISCGYIVAGGRLGERTGVVRPQVVSFFQRTSDGTSIVAVSAELVLFYVCGSSVVRFCVHPADELKRPRFSFIGRRVRWNSLEVETYTHLVPWYLVVCITTMPDTPTCCFDAGWMVYTGGHGGEID